MDEKVDEIQLVKCPLCSEEIEPDEMQETSDGVEMCQKCYDDTGICYECSDCGDIYSREETPPKRVDSGDICESCLDDHYACCSDCGAYVNVEDDEIYETSSGDPICESCYNDNYGHCECGEIDCSDNMTFFADRWYCESCANDELRSCDDCGHYMYNDDAHYNEENDECLCSRCHDRAHRDRSIHDYSYQPDYKFYHTKDEEGKKVLYLGLELEVEGNSNEEINRKAKRMVEWMKEQKIDHLYYLKSDGSLENGFEICAMPMTLKYVKKNAKLKELTEWMRNNGLSSFKKGTCGFHIHMGRNFFRGNDIGKMRGFFSSCYAQIFKLSKRGEHTSYAARENYTYQSFKDGLGQSGRYWALNCNTHKATYEVRIFRGTLNYKRLMASVEFVQAVSEYIKNVGFLSMFQVGKSGADIWKDFMNWCKRDGRFHQFYSYFTKRCSR